MTAKKRKVTCRGKRRRKPPSRTATKESRLSLEDSDEEKATKESRVSREDSDEEKGQSTAGLYPEIVVKNVPSPVAPVGLTPSPTRIQDSPRVRGPTLAPSITPGPLKLSPVLRRRGPRVRGPAPVQLPTPEPPKLSPAPSQTGLIVRGPTIVPVPTPDPPILSPVSRQPGPRVRYPKPVPVQILDPPIMSSAPRQCGLLSGDPTPVYTIPVHVPRMLTSVHSMTTPKKLIKETSSTSSSPIPPSPASSPKKPVRALIAKIKEFTAKANAKRKDRIFGEEDEDEDVDNEDQDPDWKPKKGESSDADSKSEGEQPAVVGPENVSPPEMIREFTLKKNMTTPRKRQYNLTKPRKQTSIKRRSRKTCPLCMRDVVHMVHHLREAHKVNYLTARQNAREMAIRKKERQGRLFICPVENCPSIVKRIDIHVKEVHQAEKPQDKQLVKHAQVYEGSDSDEPDLLEEEKMDVSPPVQTASSFPLKESVKLFAAPGTAIASGSSTYSTYRQVPILTTFKLWLMSIERGKTCRTALQHVNQIFSMWTSIDASLNIKSIQDEHLIRKYWLDPYREKKQPGTLKSMLGSLKEFTRYLNVEKPEGFQKEKCTDLLAAIDRWTNTLCRASRIRAVERSVDDMNRQITPAQISKALASNHSNLARLYLNQVRVGDKGPKDITRQIFTTARNFLLLHILASNAQRSGAICNLNMRAVEYAMERDDNMLMTVHEHKTGYRSPAILVISKEIWGLLRAYITMRNMITEFGEEFQLPNSKVFLTWNHKTMTPSEMNCALNSFWKEATQSKQSISATKIRKATVTNVRKSRPDLRDNLASHMTHKTATADSYYVLHDRQKESIEVTKAISDIMLGNPDEAHSEEESPASSQPGCSTCDEVQGASPSRDSISSFHPFTPLTQQEAEDESEESEGDFVRTHGRRTFTSHDAEVILSVTDAIVKGTWSIKQKDVLFVLSKDEKGKEILKKYSAKTITDRVRTARKKYLKEKERIN